MCSRMSLTKRKMESVSSAENCSSKKAKINVPGDVLDYFRDHFQRELVDSFVGALETDSPSVKESLYLEFSSFPYARITKFKFPGLDWRIGNAGHST